MAIGVPATTEHNTIQVSDSAKHVAEVVQIFITLMDSLKLQLVAVDQIHPLLSDLIQVCLHNRLTKKSLNRVSSLSAGYEGKGKIKEWLIRLNGMRAAEELEDGDSRQLLFDLESAHTEFHRTLA
jgi:ESCRT-I complex subunit VPS28